MIRSFKEEFKGLTLSTAKQRVTIWRKHLKTPERIPDYRVRMPVYGAEIQGAVSRNADEAREADLSLDGSILRRYLMVHLAKANLLELLKKKRRSTRLR